MANVRSSWQRLQSVGSIRFLLAAILVLQASLLSWSAYVHSPTWDEPGHLVAGLSHWHFGRFDLYTVNPPLVRTIASAPVYFFMNPEIDWSYYSTNSTLRTEIELGRAFAMDNGARMYSMFFVARLMLLPIALFGTWLCYAIAKEIFDSPFAGLIAATLWAFSPDSLAYGSWITTDLANAVVGIWAGWTFYKFLQQPTFAFALLLGCVTGVAMLTKSVWLILPAVYALVILFAWLIPALRRQLDLASKKRIPLRRAGWTIVASLLALTVVNAFYGFRNCGVPLGKFAFVSTMFNGGQYDLDLLPQQTNLTEQVVARTGPIQSFEQAAALNNLDCPDCESNEPTKAAYPGRLHGNRFAKSWLGAVPVPLPMKYLVGIDVQRRDFESGMYQQQWASYFAGQWQQGGWWYFYVVGLLFKTPIAFLIILIAAMIALILHRGQYRSLLLVCIAGPAIALFIVLSLNTSMTRFLRYSLPILPVLAILSGGISLYRPRTPQALHRVAAATIALLVCFVMVSLWNGPHWQSYFNIMAGGPQNGQQWFADSNVDWGQDLPLIQHWVEEHPQAVPQLNLAYYGGFSPKSVGLDFASPPAGLPQTLSKSTSGYKDDAMLGPQPGWYIISKNYVVGHPTVVEIANGAAQHWGLNAFGYFNNFEPVERIGYSTLVYHLQPDQVDRVRQDLGMRPLANPTPVPSKLVTDTAAIIVPTRHVVPSTNN